jgi:hypothetical protein
MSFFQILKSMADSHLLKSTYNDITDLCTNPNIFPTGMSEWEPTNTNSVNLKPPRFMQKYFDQRFHMPIKLQQIAFNSWYTTLTTGNVFIIVGKQKFVS